jgi:hypothetical protein
MEQMPELLARVALGPNWLRDSLFPRHQLYLSFFAMLLQREMWRAVPAQPEMFHVVFRGGKSEEPAALKTQQRPRAFRIGALGDHYSRRQVSSRMRFTRVGQDPRANLHFLLRRYARGQR